MADVRPVSFPLTAPESGCQLEARLHHLQRLLVPRVGKEAGEEGKEQRFHVRVDELIGVGQGAAEVLSVDHGPLIPT